MPGALNKVAAEVSVKEDKHTEEEKKSKKRFLALAMTLVMLLTLMAPAFTFAKNRDTKTIYVGVLNSWDQGKGLYQVHYWGDGIEAGDADLSPMNSRMEYKSVGKEYWGNEPQLFKLYTASIPSGATTYKVHRGDDWFGFGEGQYEGTPDKPHAWVSDDTNIIEVNELNGEITAKMPGTTTVHCYVDRLEEMSPAFEIRVAAETFPVYIDEKVNANWVKLRDSNGTYLDDNPCYFEENERVCVQAVGDKSNVLLKLIVDDVDVTTQMEGDFYYFNMPAKEVFITAEFGSYKVKQLRRITSTI